MAANLMRGLMAGCLLCAVSLAVSAQETLPDPTRLPAELSAPAVVGHEAAVPVNVLRSVIISPARRAAIINGQLVKMGETIGDAKLVEVNEGSVVLERAKGRETLTLFPGIKINKKEPALTAKKAVAPVLKKKSARKKKRSGKSAVHAMRSKPKMIEGEDR